MNFVRVLVGFLVAFVAVVFGVVVFAVVCCCCLLLSLLSHVFLMCKFLLRSCSYSCF